MKTSIRGFNTKKIFLGKIIDIALSLIFLPKLLFFKKNSDKNKIKNILIIELHLLGDLVIATSFLRALRKKYPHAKIFLLAGGYAKDLFCNNPNIDEIIIYSAPWVTFNYKKGWLKDFFTITKKIKKLKIDLAVDLRGDMRNIILMYFTGSNKRVSYNFTGGKYLLTDVVPYNTNLKHLVDFNLNIAKYLGCDISNRIPELTVSEKIIDEARSFLKLNNVTSDDFIIGIHPGASNKLRLWDNKKFGVLIDILKNKFDYKVIIFSGAKDKETIKDIIENTSSKPLIIETNLQNFMAYIKSCNIFIGVDSGPGHIASALGVNTIILFGPADEELVIPINRNKSIIIKKDVPCRPCIQSECTYSMGRCVDLIEVQDVVNAIQELKPKSIY